MTDFKNQSPAYALEVFAEIRDHDVTAADLLGRAIIEECGDRLRKEPDLLTPETIAALESLPFYQERIADVNARIEAMKLAEGRRMDLIGCFLGRGDTPSTAALAKIGAATDPL